MKLWRCELPCLGGYYESNAMVVAPDRDVAIERLLVCVRLWIEQRGKEYGSFGDIDAMSWEPGWTEGVDALMQRVEFEAMGGLAEVTAGWIVNVRS